MFTWICPQCGREVLPSYTECPDCSKKTPAGAPGMPPGATAGNPAGPAAPPQTWSGPVQPPAYAPPPAAPPPANFPPQQPPEPVYQQLPPQPVYQQAPPQQPVYQQPPQQPQPVYQQLPYQQPPYQQPPYQQPAAYQPPPQYAAQRPRAQGDPGFLHGMPTWLLTVLFAVVFGAVGMAIYWWVGSPSSNGTAAATTPATNVENPSAKAGAKTNPLQKYVEISGVRFTEDAKKNILVKFIVTNHSDSDLSGLAGNATIWGRTQKSEEDAVGTFSFATDVAPEAFKEVSAPLTTKLKIYELPDWQNVTTDLQITSPQ